MKWSLVFIILVLGCNSHPTIKENETTASSFNQFLSKIPKLKLPVTLYDSTVFGLGPQERIFDTNDIIKFNLIQHLRDTNFPIKKLTDFECAPIGQYRKGSNLCILYKANTTDAGNGGPEVELAIFDTLGNLMERTGILDWFITADPFYPYHKSMANWVTIYDSVHFTNYTTNVSWYKDTNKYGLTPVSDISVRISPYLINTNSHVVELKGRDSLIFENDTIPSEDR